MTNLSDIILAPKGPIGVGSNLQIVLLDGSSSKRSISNFDFVKKRVRSGQVSIGPYIEETLKNLVESVNLDYPSIFKGEVIGGKVKIGVLKPEVLVADVISFDPSTHGAAFDSEIILTPWNPFNITEVIFSKDLIDPCSYVRLRVQTSSTMTSYCINQTCYQINSNVYEQRILRGSAFEFRAVRGDASELRSIQAPALLTTPFVNITNSPYGSTVIVHITNSSGLELLFSLGGSEWQNDNVFNGLPVGAYVVVVRDQFGCEKSKEFVVLENNFESKSNTFISKENSFRFIEPKGVHFTDENRGFSEGYSTINYCYDQEFLNSDIVTTQFKSNYQNVFVKVTNLLSGGEEHIPVIKKTNNIGLRQKLSGANKYKINDSQFGIYFSSGAVLDYDSDIPIENYQLNGSLPMWAKLGNYVRINGAYYLISSIGFDESLNAEVLIFEGYAPEANQIVNVSCTYNLQEYEVYEFDLIFSNYPNTKIRIEIINSDPNFGEHKWTSEILRSSEELARFLEIRYHNLTNTNIVYSTGIKHLLRLPFNTIKAVDTDTSEDYKTDTNTYLLDSRIYEVTEFDFMPFPLELWRKLKIALSLDSVFIDGIGYSKNGEFTKEPLLGTNLYRLSAQMIKNGFSFRSSLDNSEIIIDSPVVNIPGLVSANSNGFVEY